MQKYIVNKSFSNSNVIVNKTTISISDELDKWYQVFHKCYSDPDTCTRHKNF